MHIVQIAPWVAAGTGIPGVAWQLQREFTALGHTVEAITADQLVPRRWRPRSTVLRQVSISARMVLMAFTGTRRARAFLAERPDAVSICHSGVMAGDVYVEHVIPLAALRARGNTVWRMLRNPAQPFMYLRDLVRFRGRTHRGVVALTTTEAQLLRDTFGTVRPPVTVIPHGVDLERFRPPTEAERETARAKLTLDDEHRVALFVGHELRWKGLPLLIDALVQATTVLLLVVGGNAKTLPMMQQRAERLGVADRVLFVGVHTDIRPFLAAADMFVLPSSYESYSLVITEALASGVPVIATRVGCAPELVRNGETGYLVDADPTPLAERMEQIAATDVAQWRDACRRSVEGRSWRTIAEQYVELLAEVRPPS